MAAASTAIRKRRPFLNLNKVNLFLDVALALAFVLVLEEHFTGLTLHELIGLGFGIGMLVHFILHLKWFFSITRKFFNKLFHESRLNYLLTFALIADLFLIVITGLGISRTLGLNLGLDQSLSQSFESLHKQASTFALLIVGLHVGLHWKWIVTYSRKYIFHLPFRRPVSQQNAAPSVIVIAPQHPTGGVS